MYLKYKIILHTCNFLLKFTFNDWNWIKMLPIARAANLRNFFPKSFNYYMELLSARKCNTFWDRSNPILTFIYDALANPRYTFPTKNRVKWIAVDKSNHKKYQNAERYRLRYVAVNDMQTLEFTKHSSGNIWKGTPS